MCVLDTEPAMYDVPCHASIHRISLPYRLIASGRLLLHRLRAAAVGPGDGRAGRGDQGGPGGGEHAYRSSVTDTDTGTQTQTDGRSLTIHIQSSPGLERRLEPHGGPGGLGLAVGQGERVGREQPRQPRADGAPHQRRRALRLQRGLCECLACFLAWCCFLQLCCFLGGGPRAPPRSMGWLTPAHQSNQPTNQRTNRAPMARRWPAAGAMGRCTCSTSRRSSWSWRCKVS